MLVKHAADSFVDHDVSGDNDGRNPANIEMRSADYMESETLICPSVNKGVDSCVYRGADLGKLSQMSELSSRVFIHDKCGNHLRGERDVGFDSGHVERVSEAAFQGMIEEDNSCVARKDCRKNLRNRIRDAGAKDYFLCFFFFRLKSDWVRSTVCCSGRAW